MQLTECTVDVTNCAGSNELSDLNAQGKEPRPNRLHQEQILLLCCLHELLRLCRCDRKSFLTENMLSGLQRQHGILEVVAMRRSNVDDLDIRVSN